MAIEFVAVSKIETNGVWVEAVQKSACGSCEARRGCGQNSLNQLGRTMSLWVDITDKAVLSNISIGQTVSIAIPDGGITRGALLAYGVPLVFMLVIASTSSAIFNMSELGVITSTVIALLCGFAVSRKMASRHHRQFAIRLLSTHPSIACSDSISRLTVK